MLNIIILFHSILVVVLLIKMKEGDESLCSEEATASQWENIEQVIAIQDRETEIMDVVPGSGRRRRESSDDQEDVDITDDRGVDSVEARGEPCPKRRTVDSRLPINKNVTLLSSTDVNVPASEFTVSKKKDDRRHTANKLSFVPTRSMMSNNKSVIIVKPISDGKYFLTDPVGLAKGIQNSLFNRKDRKDIRINKHKNLLVIEFNDISDSDMNKLLKIDKIGKWTVECYVPMSQQKVSGVIKGVHPSVDLEELYPLMTVTNSNAKILKLTRLPKFVNHVKSPSAAVKIDFDGEALPGKVYVDFMSYVVHPYVAPPLRCYNCQRIGHTANGCDAKPRCLVCAGEHSKGDCSSETVKCANCGGPHVASSSVCVYLKEAKELNQYMSEGKSFQEARNIIIGNKQTNKHYSNSLSHDSQPFKSYTNKFSSVVEPRSENISRNVSENNIVSTNLKQHVITADIHNSPGSYMTSAPSQSGSKLYSDVTRQSDLSRPTGNSDVEVINSYTVQHQEVNNNDVNKMRDGNLLQLKSEIEVIVNNSIEKQLNSMFSKLGSLLVEVFSVKLHEEGPRERELLLIGMIRNHFGNKVSEPLLQGLNNKGVNVNVSKKTQNMEVSHTLEPKSNVRVNIIKKSTTDKNNDVIDKNKNNADINLRSTNDKNKFKKLRCNNTTSSSIIRV